VVSKPVQAGAPPKPQVLGLGLLSGVGLLPAQGALSTAPQSLRLRSLPAAASDVWSFIHLRNPKELLGLRHPNAWQLNALTGSLSPALPTTHPAGGEVDLWLPPAAMLPLGVGARDVVLVAVVAAEPPEHPSTPLRGNFNTPCTPASAAKSRAGFSSPAASPLGTPAPCPPEVRFVSISRP